MEKKDEVSMVEVYRKFQASLKFLWSKKWWVILLGSLGIVLGFTYAFLTPTQYKSKLTFFVEQSGNSGRLSSLTNLANNLGLGSLDGGAGFYDNQQNLEGYLKSRSLVEETLISEVPTKKVTFAKLLAQSQGWDKEWKKDKKLSKVSFDPNKPRDKYTADEDSLLYEMYNYLLEENILQISLPEEGSIIVISVTEKDQTFSRYFPEVLLEFVSKNYSAAKTKIARESVDILQHQVDSVRIVLYEAMSSSAGSSDRIFGLNPAYGRERVTVGKQQVQIEVASALLKELIKNLELAKLRLMDEKPLIEIIDRPNFPVEEIKKSKIIYAIVGGICGGIVCILFLLGVRFIRQLDEASSEN